MKPKIILCLALVLSDGLFGCSTMPSGALSNSVEGKLFSNREAINLKSNDSSRPWQLKYALTERTWNEGELFLTVHERISSLVHPEIDPESTAAIYFKVGDKLKLLKRLTQGDASCFLKPNVIWVSPKGEDHEQLVQITELFYGSGALTQEHIFTTVVDDSKSFTDIPDIKIEEVQFTPAWENYQFGKDEHLWKGEWNTFSDEKMSFGFLVWKNDKDNYEVPVDKITGTYKLERKSDDGLQIVTDTLKHEAVKDEDWH